MNKDKALEIALEALELHGKQYPHMVKGYCLDAIAAIKEALETKDEPVAYINVEERKLEWANKFITWETPTVVNLPKIPLYTTPQRKPLTREDIDRLHEEDCFSGNIYEITAEIEAAHGIKE